MAEIVAFALAEKPHIICVQETFLNHQSSCYVPNYSCVRADRQSHGGGLATFVRHDVNFSVAPNQFQLCSGEVLTIVVKIQQASINIMNVYFPRNTASIGADFQSIFSVNSSFACGDWNAKHPLWSQERNAAGTKLADLLPMNNSAVFAPDEPTHWAPSGNSSTIDFAVSNVPYPIVVSTIPNLQSDHIGVWFEVSVCPLKYQRRVRDYKNANWPMYERMLSQEIVDIHHETPQEIDDACRRFSEAIVKAHDAAVPLKLKNDDGEILSRTSLQLIRQKNMIVRRWLRMRADDPLKATYASLVKQIKKVVKRSVYEDRNKCWARYMHKCEKSPRKFWAVTRRIRRGKAGIPSLIVNDRSVNDSQSKANEFAKLFAAAHTLFNAPQNEFDRITEARHAEILTIVVDGPADFTDYAELMTIIGSRKNKVAIGLDGVSNTMLKKLPVTAVRVLADIFNKAFSYGHWPGPFKEAVIIPLCKRGKPANRT